MAATAFNKRGGANGSCIKVTTCDDGGNVDQAVACVRTIDKAGVVATVNDQGTAGQADVSEAMATAKIPRIASNVTQDDWGDPNAYPLDASGTGVTFLLPQALIDEDINKIGTHPRRPRRGLGAARAPQADLRGRRDVPLRRPGPGRHHRLQPVHPRRAERRRRRRDARAR